MQRFDRHERIVMHRRKRERAHNNRPRPWFWVGQGVAAIFLAVFLSVTAVVGAGAATVFGIYTCLLYTSRCV